MFPNFPNLAETIAAERVADFQRDAAQYRHSRRVDRSRRFDRFRRAERSRRVDSSVLAAQHASRSRSQLSADCALAGTASTQSCATSHAI
jgi:hypothetical protein